MNQTIRKVNSQKSIWKNPLMIVCLVAVGYWLFTYHNQHLLGWLPYIILLLCPLMHIFMHGGHHGHGESQHHNVNEEDHKEHHLNEKGT